MSKPRSALRVGVDAAPPPPLCYGVPGDPEFKGFEVDLMHALAERAALSGAGPAASLRSRLHLTRAKTIKRTSRLVALRAA